MLARIYILALKIIKVKCQVVAVIIKICYNYLKEAA